MTHDSDAGWSGDDPLDDPERPSTDRYAWEDVLGAGGGGVVHVVFDHRLGREVALKQARRGGVAERLAWEAWVTAHLDHPAIVPVYDSGTLPDGSTFFTMRLVRGLSLARAIDDAQRPSGADSLVRTFLTLCQGVAHAHARGVVHRDLKPANVMIGELGEVQVVDWGLAALTSDSPLRALLSAPNAPSSGPVTRPVGTAGYASPEQAAAAEPSRHADVYALGRVLQAIVGDRSGPELRAVVLRATAAEPEARYASAAELALDIDAYLEGRRVAAHRYSNIEIARRFVRAWRVPLAVAAFVLVAVGTVTLAAFERVSNERGRAREAERDARAALAREERALGQALEGRAVTAYEDGDYAAAYVLASHALLRGELATARGVAAAVRAAARPAGVERLPSLPCAQVRHHASGDVLCLQSDHVSLHPGGAAAWTWRVPARAIDARFCGDDVWLLERERAWRLNAEGEVVLELRGAYPARALLVTEGAPSGAAFGPQLALEGIAPRTPCHGRATHVLALGRTRIAALCGGGVAVIERHDGSMRQELAVPFGDAILPAFTASFDPEEEFLAVGGVGGEVALLSLRDGALRTLGDGYRAPIVQLVFAAAGLVVRTEHDAIVVVELSSGGELLRLPSAQHVQIVEGELITVNGTASRRWHLPTRPTAQHLASPSGLSSAVIEDEWIAAGRGDGTVSVWSRLDGHLLSEVRVGDGVVKRLARVDDRLYAAIAGVEGVARIRVDTWSLVDTAADGIPRRRVVALRAEDGAEILVTAPYRPGLRVGLPGSETVLETPEFIDLSATPNGRAVVLLARGGQLWVFRVGEQARALPARDPRTVAVAMTDGGRTVRVTDDALVLESPARRIPLDGGPLDVDVSADGEWVAVALRDGRALVFDRAGQHHATLVGPEGRVSWIGFPDEHTLVTASWDGGIRFHDVAAFSVSAEEMAADATRTWDLGLDSLLDRTAQ